MKLPSILAALALTSCATVPPAEAGPTAGLGQLAETNGIRVRPMAVIEDSRCPVDVQCVWAGRLVVRSEVIGGNWHETRDLELGKPQHIADGALVLVSGVPQKKAGAAIDPRSYRFTFRFDGGL
jgi:hypothetical protein